MSFLVKTPSFLQLLVICIKIIKDQQLKGFVFYGKGRATDLGLFAVCFWWRCMGGDGVGVDSMVLPPPSGPEKL